MATSAAMPDMKVSDPGSLAAMTGTTTVSSQSRQALADRADRSTDRVTASFGTNAGRVAAPDVWLLPMTSYTVSAPYGERTGTLHRGVNLVAAEGTPFYAAHGGTVTLARWTGGYGYCVIVDVGNGVQLVYGHAAKLLVHEGQKVGSGDLLALTGNTGYSFAAHLHFEVRVNGTSVDPVGYMFDHGVDIGHHHDSLTG